MDQPLMADFRRTMGYFATGVTVIATGSGEELHVMTANAVTSLSLDPLLVLVCIGKKARMMAHLSEATGFSINFLREDQRALSTYFAGGWQEPTPPPFRFVPWDGAPRLEGCLAALCCSPYRQVEAGDHWIVIGEVQALHLGIEPHRPLLFFGGKYGRIDTRQAVPAPDLTTVDTDIHIFYDPWQSDSP